MSARKNIVTLCLSLIACFFPLVALSAMIAKPSKSFLPGIFTPSLSHHTLAQELGWIESDENYCGGYYLEAPFVYPVSVGNETAVGITSNQSLFSQHGTSILEGKVTVTRTGQQITSNKAYLYRDPNTGKLNAIDMIGNVHLREPNTLIVAKKGRYNFNTQTKSLIDIFYRTSVSSNKELVRSSNVSTEESQKERKITGLTAWGKASEFSQTEPKVYDLTNTSYSTCPPIDPAWRLKASHVVLDKNTGRGTATNVRILVKNVPVFYTPYINFPIDSRRKTGFLYPTFGINNKWGPYFIAPFYWNTAPNYDMTLTPSLISKRGVQLGDEFRYLSETSQGSINVTALPHDKLFATCQRNVKNGDLSCVEPAAQAQAITDAEINRLVDASSTRKSFSWRDKSTFTEHWSSNVDFNYASDDYFLQDFGSNLNELTENQLLQQGDIYYKGQNWNFTGRLQSYQTLHPVNSSPILNQYRRFPQFILNGDYPDQPLGLEYFISNEVTHFEMLKTPGGVIPPIGNRLHTQPGISLPLTWPFFFVNPRIQLALTDYNLYQTSQTNTPTSVHRSLPIFDVAAGFSLNRNLNIFSYDFEQTLEPQVYYTYIPFKNQSSIPLFDTTMNNLTYDQLFNYNRFTGIDRIGDANQLAAGFTTRLIDLQSGLEKVRLGVGGIIYFANRLVDLSTTNTSTDNPKNHLNYQRLSPITGTLTYKVNPTWSAGANSLWNPTTKQLDSTTLSINYAPKPQHTINLGYTFVRNGDYFTGITTNTAKNNLKLTDLSFVWPLLRDFSTVGRWSHDWNTNHFQNLLYGVQYDTCCWAFRFVGERTFTFLLVNNTPQYNNGFYIQFALKGLSTVGTRDASGLLTRSVPGYTSQFGQDI
jgi:LPS-assembly protein